ncbi:MAG TPA: acyl-CoA dehydrogenase family protein [Acidimicrobiales bacterium]|jgi:hypothetical protein|nr:acyl-CoA dehydrogenase family protein [Acidimicrobiales bacterium]
MDDDDRRLFEGSLRHACASFRGAALDRALDEIGWHEALSVDPSLAVSTLFEQLGRTNAHASALDAVLGSALGLKRSLTVGAVLPAVGQWLAPGQIIGGALVVNGVGTASLVECSTAWVVVGSGDRHRAVEVATAELTFRPVGGVDPQLGLVEVAGEGMPIRARDDLAPGQWPQAVALAQLAVAHALVGASRTMLELARGHALQRIQFGQPIATFQAVRHRLADTLVAIEATDAALASAWEEGSPWAAALAKALAGRSARTAIRHCQQVLAGIGFTTEHDFHHYVRRVLVFDELFGTARTLTRNLGRELLATRHLPAFPPL